MKTLKDILGLYRKEDLKHYAGQLHMTKISSLNKPELAARVAEELTKPEVMMRRLAVITDAQMKIFEKVVKKSFKPDALEEPDAFHLNDLDYCYLESNGELIAPEDVKEAYENFDQKEFIKLRSKLSWLMKCLDLSALYHGIAPVYIIHKMYQDKPGCNISKEEFMNLFQMIPEDMRHSSIVEDQLIYNNYLDGKRGKALQNMQGDKPYYIPGYREVETYAQKQYLCETKSYQELLRFLRTKLSMTYEEAEVHVCAIWNQIALGYTMNEAMEMLVQKGIVFNDEADIEEFVAYMKEANNNTRMLVNRGYTPYEIGRMRRTVIPEKDKKVYPNDPCPCGSGKKYKKCCGR